MSINPFSVEIPILEVISGRAELRKKWKAEFETHHQAFVASLAANIAEHAIKKFTKDQANPVCRALFPGAKSVVFIPIDFVNKTYARGMGKFAKESAELPPFKEWIEGAGEENEDCFYFMPFSCKITELLHERIQAYLDPDRLSYLGDDLKVDIEKMTFGGDIYSHSLYRESALKITLCFDPHR